MAGDQRNYTSVSRADACAGHETIRQLRAVPNEGWATACRPQALLAHWSHTERAACETRARRGRARLGGRYFSMARLATLGDRRVGRDRCWRVVAHRQRLLRREMNAQPRKGSLEAWPGAGTAAGLCFTRAGVLLGSARYWQCRRKRRSPQCLPASRQASAGTGSERRLPCAHRPISALPWPPAHGLAFSRTTPDSVAERASSSSLSPSPSARGQDSRAPRDARVWKEEILVSPTDSCRGHSLSPFWPNWNNARQHPDSTSPSGLQLV